jgi:hypothetical protein
MRRLWTALSGSMALVVLLSGLGATPASAVTTAEKFCVVWVNKTYRLTVSAEYTDNTSTRTRTWTAVRYRLQGGDSDEDSNNVIIRVHENGSEIWSYSSPDSLVYDRYYVRSITVRTAMDAKVLIMFGGIFDRSLGGDPSCTAMLRA